MSDDGSRGSATALQVGTPYDGGESSELHPTNVEGRFQAISELGRGGMGQVQLVYDRVLEREAAMKSLDPELAQRPDARQRFIAEARVASRLEHPNTVPVHELGIDSEGRPYFTMKVIRGVDLHQWLAAVGHEPGSMARLSEGLEVFLKVCDAVAYAHSQGVIHRDIKPANVMVGEFGEVYLVDWGIAHLAAEAPPSQRPAMVGTPAFMSPEQAQGRADEANPRTDVFGLGALLYFLVTGRAPYPQDDLEEVFEAARAARYLPIDEALPDSPVAPQIHRIVDRALQLDPALRYPSVTDLQRDARRFLRGGLHLPRRRYAAGRSIVQEGAQSDEVFIIVAGTCEAYLVEQGERRVIRTMAAGDVFGEMAFLTQRARTASVDAVDDVTVLVVSSALLADELGDGSWLGLLLRSLAERFRDLDDRVRRAGDAMPPSAQS